MPVTALKFKDICNKLDDQYLGLLAHFKKIYQRQCTDMEKYKYLLSEKNDFIQKFERLQKLAIQNINKEENNKLYTKAMSIMDGAVESLIQEMREHLKPSNKIKNNDPISINNYNDKDLLIKKLQQENSQLKDLLTKSTKENFQLKQLLDGYSNMTHIVNKDIMGDDHNNDCSFIYQSKYCNSFQLQKNGYNNHNVYQSSYNVGPPLPNPSLNINLTASKLKLDDNSSNHSLTPGTRNKKIIKIAKEMDDYHKKNNITDEFSDICTICSDEDDRLLTSITWKIKNQFDQLTDKEIAIITSLQQKAFKSNLTNEEGQCLKVFYEFQIQSYNKNSFSLNNLVNGHNDNSKRKPHHKNDDDEYKGAPYDDDISTIYDDDINDKINNDLDFAGDNNVGHDGV